MEALRGALESDAPSAERRCQVAARRCAPAPGTGAESHHGDERNKLGEGDVRGSEYGYSPNNIYNQVRDARAPPRPVTSVTFSGDIQTEDASLA